MTDQELLALLQSQCAHDAATLAPNGTGWRRTRKWMKRVTARRYHMRDRLAKIKIISNRLAEGAR